MPIRLALRALLQSPGFTLVALTTLALGIGINTSMFSVIETLMFRAGPFPDAEQIVQLIGRTPSGDERVLSYAEIREIESHVTGFSSFTVIGTSYAPVAEAGRPTVRLAGINACANLFKTFGVQPMLGRPFTREETQPGRNHVIVLSHFGWRTRYGSDPSVIGRTLRIEGETVEIIGVMPRSFDYPLFWQNAHYFRPLNYTRDQIEWRDFRAFRLIGRLATGVDAARITTELAPLVATQAKSFPEVYTNFRYIARPLHEMLIDDLARKISWTVVGLSASILLLACANLANLQLARAAGRTRELGIRAALGASRSRLILHQLCESVLLGLGGGALGLGVAYVINRIASREFAIGAQTPLVFPIDGSILAITIGVSMLTGIAFGLVPALLATRTAANTALKAQARGSTAGRGHRLARSGLIVAEVAIALVLLGVAASMQRGLGRFLERDVGWDTSRLLTAQIGMPETHFENHQKRLEYFRRLELRLAELPGVEHAALATSMPVRGYNGTRPVLLEGQSQADAATLPKATHVMVTTDFFATIGIPLIEGRLFPPELPAGSPDLAIVNETFARQFWPGESAVGRRIASIDSGKVFWFEIIGVVADVEDAASLRPPETPFTIYRPLSQEPWSWFHLLVRAPAPETLVEPLRRVALDADPDLPADLIATVREITDESHQHVRLAANTLTAFAGLGLLLAAVGIYGVVASVVVQRTSEFGIRLALGAQPGDVLALVLRYGFWLAGTGLVVGLAGAYVLTRVLGNFMPRLGGPDLLVLGAAALGLMSIALCACYVPARRATKVDPLIALRSE